ncbi:DUF4058 family protein [Synechococcus sp. PCC 7336]|uniref:DUF4058 family protein n=1 Tax=Synechococcus sp. PCC 7336 TaxID=195250 RepID=UPI0004755512|nr:DUF4058 family protein [Synechococcus sp. PCC 7336]
MSDPFPGMNPYLEHPDYWPEVHHLLIGILAESLNPQLLPKYRVAIEKRVYRMSGDEALLVGIPDVTVERAGSAPKVEKSPVALAEPPSAPLMVTVPMPVEFREGYLEVRETATQAVIAAIEVLSPTNKRSGKGRETYESKRQAVLGSRTHLVEIDLLRGGEAMPVLGDGSPRDYRILVSRSEERPRAELYRFDLSEAIPTFPLPLRASDREPVVDLRVLLSQVYERAGYEVVMDYSRDPVPPLSDRAAVWMDNLLREKGLRRSGG